MLINVGQKARRIHSISIRRIHPNYCFTKASIFKMFFFYFEHRLHFAFYKKKHTAQMILAPTTIPTKNGAGFVLSGRSSSINANTPNSRRKEMINSANNACTGVTFSPGSMSPKFPCISGGVISLMISVAATLAQHCDTV